MPVLIFTTMEFFTGAATLTGFGLSAYLKLISARITNVKEKNEKLEQQIIDLRTTIQLTREHYLEESKFDQFAVRLFDKLEHIEEKLSNKVDRSECHDFRLNRSCEKK